MLSDETIVHRIQNGETELYRILVERYNQPILNLCYRYLGDEEEARDAAQEIFIKAYRHLFRWSPRARFFTWLYRIAINHCQNLLRYRRIRQWFSLSTESHVDFFDPVPSAATSLESREQDLLVQHVLLRLSNKDREVLILYYFLDLSYQEIAEVLGISLSAVEARLHRAKKHFATQYLTITGKPPPL